MQVVAIAVIIGTITFLLTVIAIAEYDENRTTARWRRNSMVTAVLSSGDERVWCQGAVSVDFANRSAKPVLVGLSVRTQFWPSWRRARQKTKVPSRPGRRRYRADAQQTIGVVPANGIVRLPVRIPSGSRRRRVVAVVGEADGHLRVISMRIPARRAAGTDRFDGVVLGDLSTWLL